MIPHRPHHGLLVILVLLLALFTWREVRGQASAAPPGTAHAASAASQGDKRQADRDKGVARDEGSTTARAWRSAKRAAQRVRDKLVAIAS